MRIKLIAGCAFLLNTIFFATYYSVAKEALSRIDPIVFTFFEMVSLAPLALVIILWTWRDITRAVIKRGILLGSVLCLALFTIAIALKYTTATSTAFFPAMNGFVAALIAWMLFREPLKGRTWFAGLLSLAGAALLILTSAMGSWRGTLIAFLGGLFYTFYVFLCDHEQKEEQAAWPLFGIELLTTAGWAGLVVLLFGDWQAVHPVLPKDVGVVLYVSLACTFMPTLITVLLQKYISPVTVSFIYVLEPVLGAIIAYLYLREELPIQGYIGGAMVVLGALIQTWGTMGKPSPKKQVARAATTRAAGSWISTQLYPGLSCILGTLLLANLGGIPPTSWHDLYHIWPQMAQYTQDGQGTYITLLLVQAGGWLVAWVAVLLMGCLALYHTLRRLFQPAQVPQTRRVTPASTGGRPGPQTVIQPTRRVRTAARLPEQQMPLARTTVRLPEQQPVRTRTTIRLPEQRVATATLQAEQPTWYGQAVWNNGSGPDTPLPSITTEPLQHERVQALEWHAEAAPPIKRRASLERQQVMGQPSLERLDA